MADNRRRRNSPAKDRISPPMTSDKKIHRGRDTLGGRHVALIRGINVGRAKRVAMADLRALVEDLGYGDVRTLLNSGNVVFTSARRPPAKAAARIEEGLWPSVRGLLISGAPGGSSRAASPRPSAVCSVLPQPAATGRR